MQINLVAWRKYSDEARRLDNTDARHAFSRWYWNNKNLEQLRQTSKRGRMVAKMLHFGNIDNIQLVTGLLFCVLNPAQLEQIMIFQLFIYLVVPAAVVRCTAGFFCYMQMGGKNCNYMDICRLVRQILDNFTNEKWLSA